MNEWMNRITRTLLSSVAFPSKVSVNLCIPEHTPRRGKAMWKHIGQSKDVQYFPPILIFCRANKLLWQYWWRFFLEDVPKDATYVCTLSSSSPDIHVIVTSHILAQVLTVSARTESLWVIALIHMFPIIFFLLCFICLIFSSYFVWKFSLNIMSNTI